MKRIALTLLLISGAAIADKPGDYHEYQSDPELFMLLYTGNVAKRFKPMTAGVNRQPASLAENPRMNAKRKISFDKLPDNK